MILAAGKGTRVRPLTHDLPKAMIPILGKPVMEYLIEHLAAHDVRQLRRTDRVWRLLRQQRRRDPLPPSSGRRSGMERRAPARGARGGLSAEG
jgi:molybdopterin-guanine dinucleotide biosynthesis protein A